jgi:hypothetical protein
MRTETIAEIPAPILPQHFDLSPVLSQKAHVSPKLLQIFQNNLAYFIHLEQKKDLSSNSLKEHEVVSSIDFFSQGESPFLIINTKKGPILIDNLFAPNSPQYKLVKALRDLYQQSRPYLEQSEKAHVIGLPAKKLLDSPTTQKITQVASETQVLSDSQKLTGFLKYFHKFLDFTLDWLIPVSDVWAVGRNGLSIGSDVLQISLVCLLLVPLARIAQGIVYIPQGAAWLRDGLSANEKSSKSLDTRGKIISDCDIFSGISSIVEGLLWITLGSLILAGEAVAAATITFILFNVLFVISFAILIAKGIFGLAEAVAFKKKMQAYLEDLEKNKTLSDAEKIQRVTDFFKDQIQLSTLEIEEIKHKITEKTFKKLQKDKKFLALSEKAQREFSKIEIEKALTKALEETKNKKELRKKLRFERRTSEDFVKLVKERLVDPGKLFFRGQELERQETPLSLQQALSLHKYAKEANNKALLKNIVFLAIGILGEVGAVISNVTVVGDIAMWMALNTLYLLFLDLGTLCNRLYKWQLTDSMRREFGLPLETADLSSKQVNNLKSLRKQLRIGFGLPPLPPDTLTSKQAKDLTSLMQDLEKTLPHSEGKAS